MPRTRHTFIDDNYASSLPPDLLAFPARMPPNSPSMQSSHSNIPEQMIYGIRSPPPPLTSPVYAHMTPHGIYGTSAIAATSPNGFMTLQHPKARNLAIVANNRQQSPFLPAPVIYSPATAATVVMKQGYMTIPRKPRVPSWAASSSASHTAQLMGEFQSPNMATHASDTNAQLAQGSGAMELISEPVYDNLGLRTTAGGSSTLNLMKSPQSEASGRYNMRDRPLPATPSTLQLSTASANVSTSHLRQVPLATSTVQSYQVMVTPDNKVPTSVSGTGSGMVNNALVTSKIYEPVHEVIDQVGENMSPSLDTEPLYGTTRAQPRLVNVSVVSGTTATSMPLANTSEKSSETEGKPAKIPPRPPPKPKKKIAVTAMRNGQGSTRQLFDDEGEDGTEV